MRLLTKASTSLCWVGGRSVLLRLRRREDEQVVAADAEEEEGFREQLGHRAGACPGHHLCLGRLEVAHLL
jgi:hypothetical protein